MTEATIEEGKSNAIISYLTIIGTIIAFYLNNDKKNDFGCFAKIYNHLFIIILF